MRRRHAPARLLATLGLVGLLLATGRRVSAQSHGPDSSARPEGTGRAEVGLLCEFKSGPRVGERQRVAPIGGDAKPGSPCTDGMGSTGRLVAEDATSAGATPPDPRRMTTTCEFDRGPRAGQRERGLVPVRVGAPCSDRRQENHGIAVEDGPTPPARTTRPLGGIPDESCRVRTTASPVTCRDASSGGLPVAPRGPAIGRVRPPRR